MKKQLNRKEMSIIMKWEENDGTYKRKTEEKEKAMKRVETEIM